MSNNGDVRKVGQERHELATPIPKFEGTSQKARRPPILAKADADAGSGGPNRTDDRIDEAFGCLAMTIEQRRSESCGVGPVRRRTA
ncbi:hypothetical protein AB1L88_11590 [Tautonia sp. JC769]|uniref:hypothetical protein n=1 Tax=Tautonia sp. JC769 TaxID=3232135 RepID=UPI00345A9E89